MRTLQQMLDRIRAEAAKLYAREQTLVPVFIGVRPDDSELIIRAGDAGVPTNLGARPDDSINDDGTVVPTPEAKNALNDYVRARFAAANVQLYGMAMECWVLERRHEGEFENFGRRGISQEPDRFEALWFSSEDRAGARMAGRQSIIRPRGKDPFLDDDFQSLDDYPSVDGARFVGLLKQPKPRRAHLPGLPEPAPTSMREAVRQMDPTLRNLLLSIAEIEATKRGLK